MSQIFTTSPTTIESNLSSPTSIDDLTFSQRALDLGIDLPQLKVLGSVMRTERLDGGPEISASGGLFGYRKRLDGGYTVARRNMYEAFVVPGPRILDVARTLALWFHDVRVS